MRAHLTNTCLQDSTSFMPVHLLDDLVGQLGGPAALDDIKTQTRAVVAEAFASAATSGRIHLQTWPHAWELFGVDLMVVDSKPLSVLLLEINAVSFAGAFNNVYSALSGILSYFSYFFSNPILLNQEACFRRRLISCSGEPCRLLSSIRKPKRGQ